MKLSYNKLKKIFYFEREWFLYEYKYGGRELIKSLIRQGKYDNWPN